MSKSYFDSCKYCSTRGSCPFSFTDESEQVQNYGCLPTPMEIIKMRINHNKTWACHSDITKPCLGALNYLKKYNLPFKVIDSKLLNEESDWHLYVSGQNPKINY